MTDPDRSAATQSTLDAHSRVEGEGSHEARRKTRNIRMTVAYDGTDYVGWQVQPNGTSVQSVVESALQKLTGEDIRVLAAGRTDSGVHAVGQVVSFPTSCTIPGHKFASALSNHLPDDIIIRESSDAGDEFHATYSATRKRYRYVMYSGDVCLPFLKPYVWHYRAELDVSAMNDAAARLIGTHDFRCFESHFPNKATSVRTVLEAALTRQPVWPVWSPAGLDALSDSASDTGKFICFDIVADGFLYNMVRAIVGSLIKVGRGRWSPDDITKIIAGQDRSHGGETAPACGLYLIRVDYGDDR